ncbi:MAG: GNAT family N-acetyltransferase [Mediterranea massiliensis]|nr:GNAT family N-acetyltransferase [Mediterranea massiliensis]
MSDNYLQGEKIYLRVLEPEDLEVLYMMENDPQTWDISNFSVPYSRYLLKQYIADSQSDMFADRQLRLMIVEKESDEVAGTLDITDFAPMHMRGEVGIAVRKNFQAKGYASEALHLLAEYVFRFLNFRQLTAHVLANNETALSLFQRAGYEECGRLKAWWRVGNNYEEVVLLQKLHS